MAETPTTLGEIKVAFDTTDVTALTDDQHARAEALIAARTALYGPGTHGIAAPTPLLDLARWITNGDPEPEPADGCGCDLPEDVANPVKEPEDEPADGTPYPPVPPFMDVNISNIKLPDPVHISEVLAAAVKNLRAAGGAF
jgi:hypothetical protein